MWIFMMEKKKTHSVKINFDLSSSLSSPANCMEFHDSLTDCPYHPSLLTGPLDFSIHKELMY